MEIKAFPTREFPHVINIPGCAVKVKSTASGKGRAFSMSGTYYSALYSG